MPQINISLCRAIEALAVLLAAASTAHASRPFILRSHSLGSPRGSALSESRTAEEDGSGDDSSDLPVIPTPQFCDSTGFNNPNLGAIRLAKTCSFLGILEELISKETSSCTDDSLAAIVPPIDTSLTGQSLPSASLPDMRPLPTFLDTASIAKAEGADYNWYYRNVQNLAHWSPCKVQNASLPNSFVPPGWTLVGDVISVGAPIQTDGKDWPLAAVISKGVKMVIIIRGTGTAGEWLADFTYGTTANVTDLLPGATHSGFTAIANLLWEGGVKDGLDQLVSSGTAADTVTVTGHSLGAAVGTLLSVMVSNYLEQQGSSAHVDAVLFAPPNAGDSDFATAFNMLVNGRAIKFHNDIIPQVPCAPQMISCPNVLVHTGPRGSAWSYTPTAGQVVLLGMAMPLQPEAWSGMVDLPYSYAGLFVSASHTCSYMCYFSSYTGDNNNMCGLWQEDGVTSYCPGFPSSEWPAEA